MLSSNKKTQIREFVEMRVQGSSKTLDTKTLYKKIGWCCIKFLNYPVIYPCLVRFLDLFNVPLLYSVVLSTVLGENKEASK